MSVMIVKQCLFILILIKIHSVATISLSEFYPFGPANFDSLLGRGDEAIHSINDLPSPFPFFGELHRRIIVCELRLKGL